MLSIACFQHAQFPRATALSRSAEGWGSGSRQSPRLRRCSVWLAAAVAAVVDGEIGGDAEEIGPGIPGASPAPSSASLRISRKKASCARSAAVSGLATRRVRNKRKSLAQLRKRASKSIIGAVDNSTK